MTQKSVGLDPDFWNRHIFRYTEQKCIALRDIIFFQYYTES